MVEQVEAMREAEEEAARHAALVHAMPWAERAAGGFDGPLEPSRWPARVQLLPRVAVLCQAMGPASAVAAEHSPLLTRASSRGEPAPARQPRCRHV